MQKQAKISIFDFDGTITSKDTLLEFLKFTKGKLAFYWGVLLYSPVLIAMKLKFYPNDKAKQHLFSYFFKGISIKQFNQWGVDFIPHIEKMLYPKALKALKEHKSQGDKVIIISASIENWIKPWTDLTGIDLLIATQIEVNIEGKLTGRFSSKNCYGQEKVNRLLEIFPDINNYTLIAYGDSRGDKELIEIANEGWYNKFKS